MRIQWTVNNGFILEEPTTAFPCRSCHLTPVRNQIPTRVIRSCLFSGTGHRPWWGTYVLTQPLADNRCKSSRNIGPTRARRSKTPTELSILHHCPLKVSTYHPALARPLINHSTHRLSNLETLTTHGISRAASVPQALQPNIGVPTDWAGTTTKKCVTSLNSETLS